MQHCGHDAEGNPVFRAHLTLDGFSGRRGYTIRVLPRHDDLVTPYIPGLITWASDGD
jgi:hypothetical protein